MDVDWLKVLMVAFISFCEMSQGGTFGLGTSIFLFSFILLIVLSSASVTFFAAPKKVTKKRSPLVHRSADCGQAQRRVTWSYYCGALAFARFSVQYSANQSCHISCSILLHQSHLRTKNAPLQMLVCGFSIFLFLIKAVILSPVEVSAGYLRCCPIRVPFASISPIPRPIDDYYFMEGLRGPIT